MLQRFHFHQIPGDLLVNINIFCENCEASFFIKDHSQIKQMEIWILKTIYFPPPPKSAFLVFEEKPPKKFSSGFSSDLALQTINAQMFFWRVFLKSHEKVINHQKQYFCVFKNRNQKKICASLVFAKTKEKYRENFFKGFYLKNLKSAFLGFNQFFTIYFLF